MQVGTHPSMSVLLTTRYGIVRYEIVMYGIVGYEIAMLVFVGILG